MCSGRAKLVGPQRPSAREAPWPQAPPCSGQPHDPEEFGPPTDVRGAVAVVPEPFVDWPAERSLAPILPPLHGAHPVRVVRRICCLRRTACVSTGNEGGAAGRLERWL